MIVNNNGMNENDLNKVSGGLILQGYVREKNVKGSGEPIFNTYYKVVSDDYFNDTKPGAHQTFVMTQDLDRALEVARENNFSTDVIKTHATFLDTLNP